MIKQAEEESIWFLLLQKVVNIYLTIYIPQNTHFAGGKAYGLI